MCCIPMFGQQCTISPAQVFSEFLCSFVFKFVKYTLYSPFGSEMQIRKRKPDWYLPPEPLLQVVQLSSSRQMQVGIRKFHVALCADIALTPGQWLVACIAN